MQLNSIKLYTESLESIFLSKKKFIISCINGLAYYKYHTNNKYRDAVTNDLKIVDGISIVLCIWFLHGKWVKRQTGYDLLITALNFAKDNSKKILFLGTNNSTLQKIEQRLAFEYPDLDVQYIAPSFFKEEMQETELEEIIIQINQFDPQIVFVGLSLPKQEIWTNKVKNQLNSVEYFCNIGAAFNFYAGDEKRAPVFIQKIGLEGLFRTIINPKKHLPKDIRSIPFLFYNVLKQKLKKNFLNLCQFV